MDNREELFYWLLRAYYAHNKAEWELGPTIEETIECVFDVLCNNGLDPNLSTHDLVKLAKKDSRENE